jgi:hypothetical protein
MVLYLPGVFGAKTASVLPLKTQRRDSGMTPTPMKAIRKKCLDCSGNSSLEVELCLIKDCSLYPYRFGKRPQTAEKKGKYVTLKEASR